MDGEFMVSLLVLQWWCRPTPRAPDWWESARFHLCLRQGAGRQFVWLEAGSVKMAVILSHPPAG